MRPLFPLLIAAAALAQQPQFDLLIQGGHVVDPKNNISSVMDVAITAGRIARVAPGIPPAQAKRIANAAGLYVTPGLIDIHVHVYTGTGRRGLTGDSSVSPDSFSFRSGVTTMVDAGSSGARNFPDFRERVIDRSQTRVLALLNIVGGGMGPDGEDNASGMDAGAAAKMAQAHKDVVVGFKTAHFSGAGWPSVDGAVKAGNITGKPVMVDFGYVTKERNLDVLMRDKLRAGDIYTHCFSTHRGELTGDNKVNPSLLAGRQRGILFDVGHGGGSFYWNVAVPFFEQKFFPDSISTDLHTGSMNAGMKDMVNVMSKVLNLGPSLDQVIRMSTWNPARQILRTDLGHLDVGAEADITILRLEKGQFGFLDSAGASRAGSQRLLCELTIRKGAVVWDLNGRAAPDWKSFQYLKRPPAP